MADILLTPAEVARRLRKRKETVLAMIRRGELPALNMPRPSGKPRYKVRPSDLEAFEQKQLVRIAEPRRLPPGVTEYCSARRLPPGVTDFYKHSSSKPDSGLQ